MTPGSARATFTSLARYSRDCTLCWRAERVRAAITCLGGGREKGGGWGSNEEDADEENYVEEWEEEENEEDFEEDLGEEGRAGDMGEAGGEEAIGAGCHDACHRIPSSRTQGLNLGLKVIGDRRHDARHLAPCSRTQGLNLGLDGMEDGRRLTTHNRKGGLDLVLEAVEEVPQWDPNPNIFGEHIHNTP